MSRDTRHEEGRCLWGESGVLFQFYKAKTSPQMLPENSGIPIERSYHTPRRRSRQSDHLARWWPVSFLCLLFVAVPVQLAAQTTSVIAGNILDAQGRTIANAEISLSSPILVRAIKDVSDMAGSYRLAGLQPGSYQLRITKPGFAVKVYDRLVVTVNRVLRLDIVLAVSAIQVGVTVSIDAPLLDTASSSSGATILPEQIQEMPINGRNYLDLLQLVPGVALNRQVDTGTDAAVPILGERSGNAVFLVDGMPNSNAVDGGPAAPFDQDSILQFQVLTAGYKAEFGHGSG